MSQLGDLGFRTTNRASKQRNGRGCIAVLLALVVLGGAGYFVATKGQAMLEGAFTVPDFTGTGRGEVRVQVVDSASSSDIGVTLEETGVVKSAEAFIRAARNDSRALSIQPGYYAMRREMSGQAALSLILDPNSKIQDRVTVREGLRLGQTLDVLAKRAKIPEAELQAVLKDPGSLGLPKYAKNRPEGFLFPATYDINPGTTAQSLLEGMVTRYGEEARRLGLEAGAKRLKRTPQDVLTVASIIQAEVNRPADFPKVARVIYNRLDESMKLQMDSTVHYAVNKGGKVTTTRADRNSRSPYNTYRHKGLPPGPINAPGAEALKAALNPAKGDLLYFVTVNLETGATKFASDLDDHNRNVAEFQSWCRGHKGLC